MKLNNEQSEQLNNLLVEYLDDKGDMLDKIVKYYLGSAGLFKDFASRSDTFREVVYKVLTYTEEKGSTVKLFEGVLKVLPSNQAVRAVIERNLPQAILAAPETAEQVAAAAQGVKALHDSLGNEKVHALLAASRNDLERLADDLNLLSNYKKLHDVLHGLHVTFLRLIDDAARKLETDKSAPRDALREYLDQLQTKFVDAEEAAQALPDTPAERDEQMAWVLELAAAVDALREAVDKADSRGAVEVVYKLKLIARKRPKFLNVLITRTAKRMPIARLVETLQQVAGAFICEDGHARDLAGGIAALQRLIPDQMGLVSQHSEWQKIADSLWEADKQLNQEREADEQLHQESGRSLEGFQYVWEGVTKMVKSITASDPASEWAIKLNRQIAAFEKAFPMPQSTAVSDQARLCFDTFMKEANQRFYRVDKALHARCDGIVKLGRPLRALLEEIPDDGR